MVTDILLMVTDILLMVGDLATPIMEDTILITEVPTMPGITMVGMMGTTMAEAVAIIRILTTSTDISIAGIPVDIHTAPGKSQVAPREAQQMTPGTGVVPMHQRKLQQLLVKALAIPVQLHRDRFKIVPPVQFEIVQAMLLKDR